MSLIKRLYRKLNKENIEEVFAELKWINQYGIRYKWSIVWYIAIGIVGIIVGYGASILSKHIIDAVTGFQTTNALPLAIGYIAMRLFSILCGALTNRISVRINLKVLLEIRTEIYARVMEADWEDVLQFHSGDILNRLSSDVSTVSSSVLGWIPSLITGLVQFFAAFLILLYYDWVLAVFSLVSAPIIFLISRTILGKMREFMKKTREASSRLMVFNEESFQNLQFIKSFGLTDYYRERLEEVQNDYRDVSLESNLFSIRNNIIMSVVGTVVALCCFGWAVYRLWSGAITYGTMTLFLSLSGTLSGSFGSLVGLVPSALQAATAAGRIMGVSELKKEDRTAEPEAKAFLEANRRSGVVVRASQLGFTYSDDNRVFENTDFVAKPGEIVAIVGASGGGKTTFLRLLLGIVHPQEGGLELSDIAGEERFPLSPSTRCMFAYVPQANPYFTGTVGDNLRLLNRSATDEEIWKALTIACADHFIRRLPEGLDTPIRENGMGFSQGQLQRLSIARALLSEAPVILFDEATSGLDVETEKKLLTNITERMRGKTCIVTTHRASVLETCDRVYSINGTQMKCEPAEVVRKRLLNT